MYEWIGSLRDEALSAGKVGIKSKLIAMGLFEGKMVRLDVI